MKIILCGVNLVSLNRGVQALGYGSIDFLREIFPGAEIEIISHTGSKDLLGSVEQERLGRKEILKLLLGSYFPFYRANSKIIHKLNSADYVFDLSEGDSFSDIYGVKRFLVNYLFKKMVSRYAKKYVLLPQTIGPFKRQNIQTISGKLMRAMHRVYVRDYNSQKLLENLKIKTILFPDMALYMEKQKPGCYNLPFDNFVAVNVNGLLFYDASGKSLVDKKEYKKIVESVVELLLSKNESVLLVPHTYAVAKKSREDDFMASINIFEKFNDGKSKGKIAVLDQELRAPEIKYLLAHSKFTIGSRMHACLGSITSGRLSVALAYSSKFKGTFQKFGLQDWVVDLHQGGSQEDVLNLVKKAMKEYSTVSSSLLTLTHNLKSESINIFKEDLLHE